MPSNPLVLRAGDQIRWRPSFGFSPAIDGAVKEIRRLAPGESVFADGERLESVTWAALLGSRDHIIYLVPFAGSSPWAYGFQLEHPEAYRLGIKHADYMAFAADQEKMEREEIVNANLDDFERRQVASVRDGETFMARRHAASHS